jgi:hypothetical protein
MCFLHNVFPRTLTPFFAKRCQDSTTIEVRGVSLYTDAAHHEVRVGDRLERNSGSDLAVKTHRLF